MTSPFIPCPFTYGDAPQGGSVMPMIIAGRNPSNVTDNQYAPGYLWLSDKTQGGSGVLYYQGGYTAGVPAWTIASAAVGALDSLSDGTNTVTPIGGNISVLGTENQITVTGNDITHSLILSLPSNMIVPDNLTVIDDLDVGGDLNVSGAITFDGLTVNGEVLINTTGDGDTTIGNSSGAGAITIDAPTGNFTINGNSNSILIGPDAGVNQIEIGGTGNSVIEIANSQTEGSLSVGAAMVAGTISIGGESQTGILDLGISTAGQDINIGSGINLGAQTIDIANGNSGANSTVRILSGVGTAGVGVLQLANNTRVTSIDLGNVAPAAARVTTIAGGDQAQNDTVTILGGAPSSGTQVFNLFSGNASGGTQTVNVGTGTNAAALNLGTGGTGVKTIAMGGTAANVITIGNTQTGGSVSIGNAMTTGTISIGGTGLQTGTVSIAPGTGAQTVNVGTGGTGVKTINIGTGAVADVITIGNSTAGNITTLASSITALPGPVYVYTGAGAPANGLALHIGDLYINTTAASAVTRMYIATGVGAWTNITCAA